MLILAGLGNPGPRYEKNRHNIGFMAADAIARRWSFSPWRQRFQGHACEGAVDTDQGPVRALLLKPQTFYNEIDLAPGRFRMKTGGGAAGNNGVRSITSQIGEGFRRARLGTGHPGDRELVHGHVLSDFHKADAVWVKPLLDAVADALPFAALGDDERYQAEVMRLAPAPKADPRKLARGEE